MVASSPAAERSFRRCGARANRSFCASQKDAVSEGPAKPSIGGRNSACTAPSTRGQIRACGAAGMSDEMTRDEFADYMQAFERRLDERFVRVDRRLDGIDGRLDGMDQRFDAVDGRFDTMDRRFDAVDGRLDAMDRRF